MLRKIVCNSPNVSIDDTVDGYALTPDNLLKMILIKLRVDSAIPVLLMGETGCGKTSLIRFLARVCGIKLEIFHLHAGITRKNIIEKVQEVCKASRGNLGKEYWIFLDEINTCEHIGLLNNVLVERVLQSEHLPPNMKCIAACNPYKRRSDASILTAGLKEKAVEDEKSPLVYRVYPLPESMLDFVWDYGSLTEDDETKYIKQMTEGLKFDLGNNNTIITDLLKCSQKFTTEVEKNDCSVSLRDVHRCVYLMNWFHNMLKEKDKFPLALRYGSRNDKDFKICAIILALSHCYEVRFQQRTDRRNYWKNIAYVLKNGMTTNDIMDIVRREQIDILNRMQLETGIAKNTALRENVFVIFVCILNCIPIFLVGKPGCSKSLSMQVLKSNMRGLDSNDDYLKTLPQLYVVSYQGSESSTSEGILKIFEKAKKYKNLPRQERIHPVVLLDEIGLAEISKSNPLKVLHNLLEPETGAFPEIAVVGISNWALDSAKMNRAIHLSRPDLSVEELIDTGKSICSDDIGSEKNKIGEDILHSLAEVYFEYYQKNQGQKHFHGLRDYYSLLKFVYFHVDKGQNSVIDAIQKGLSRNFGGLDSENKILEMFCKKLNHSESTEYLVEEMIVDNIHDDKARHLMLITKGDFILGVLAKILTDNKLKYKVLYGSKFEKDKTDEYFYRILNTIIHCMSLEIILILKDLDEIYGSLYDMLNQNYTMVGKKRNCRIALGAHSNPLCTVHQKFRCIVLQEKDNIDYSDPPFLNRFEKQFIKYSELLNPEEKELVKEVQSWTSSIAGINSTAEDDVFLGFNTETIPSLVKSFEKTEHSLKRDACYKALLQICTPEAVLCAASVEVNANLSEELSDYYMGLPTHNGLNYFVQVTLENCTCSSKIAVFTRDNIHTDLKRLIKFSSYVQYESLGSFKSEQNMIEHFEHFFTNTDLELLVVQCNIQTDIDYLLLAKLQIENARNDFLNSPLESNLKKHVMFVLHCDNRSTSEQKKISQFAFSNEWKLLTIDILDNHSLSPEIIQDSGIMKFLLKQSVFDLLQTDFHHVDAVITQHLLWAFNCIHYVCPSREPEELLQVISCLTSNKAVFDIIKNIIMECIKISQPQYPDMFDRRNWQVQVACNRTLMPQCSSLIEAWKIYMDEAVKQILCQLVWLVEKSSSWDCVQTMVVSEELPVQHSVLFSIWKNKVESFIEIFKQGQLPEPKGVHSLKCEEPVITLEVPFIREWFQSLRKLQPTIDTKLDSMGVDCTSDIQKCDMENMIANYQQAMVSLLEKTYSEFEYECKSDEILPKITKDFCNEISWSMETIHLGEKRVSLVKNFLTAKMKHLGQMSPFEELTAFFIIHCLENWKMRSLLKLVKLCDTKTVKLIEESLESLAKCCDVKENLENDVGDDQDNPENDVEDSIVDRIMFSILPGKEHLQEYGGVEKWVMETNRVVYHCSHLAEYSRQINVIKTCFDLITISLANQLNIENELSAFIETLDLKEGCYTLVLPSTFKQVHSLCNNCVTDRSLSQNIFGKFIIRWLEMSPEAEQVNMVLRALLEKDLPCKNLQYIGCFVQCLLMDFDHIIEENILEFILAEELDDYDNYLQFLHQSLSLENNVGDLTTLCTDYIEIMCRTNLEKKIMENEYNQSFVKVKELLSSLCGIQKVVGLVFCKSYIKVISCLVKDKKLETSFLQQFDSSLLDGEHLSEFYMYFIDCMSDSSVQEIQLWCQQMESCFPSTKSIKWPTDEMALGIGFNVFSVEVNYNEIIGNLQSAEFKQTIDKYSLLQDKQGMRGFIGAVASKLYWPRYIHGRSKDKDNDMKEYIASKFPNKDILHTIIKRISGCEEFTSNELSISAQNSYSKLLQANFILHLLIYVATNKSTMPNLIEKCVLSPHEIEKTTLKPLSSEIELKSKFELVKCICLNRTIAEMKIDRCPICNNQVESTDLGIVSESESNDIPLMQFLLRNDYQTHERYYALILQAALIGSLNLGKTTLPWLDEGDWMKLKANFQKNWDSLKAHFTKEINFSFFLHKFLIDNEECLFGSDVTERFAFVLSRQFIDNNSHKNDFRKQVCVSSDENAMLRVLAQVQTSCITRNILVPSIENMVSTMQLVCAPNDSKHLFLKLVLKWEKQLEQLKCLIPILEWLGVVQQYVSHQVTREEAESMDIQRFCEKTSDKIKQQYEAICDASKFLRIPDYNKKCHFKYDTKLSVFVVENDDHFLVEVVDYLLNIQNQFLAESGCLAIKKHPSLDFLYHEGNVSLFCKSISQLVKKDIVTFEWPESLLRFVQNDTNIEYGDCLHLQFSEIENQLASLLLLGKPCLTKPSNLFQTIYKNEMFHSCSYLFDEIHEQIPQKFIDKESKAFIFEENKNKESMRATMDFLEIVISMINKTGGHADENILSYSERWKIGYERITSDTMKSQLKQRLKLCHLIDLYECLEDCLINISSNSVPDIYQASIPLVTRESLETYISANAQALETALKRFFSRYIMSSTKTQVFDKALKLKLPLANCHLWPGITSENGHLIVNSNLLKDFHESFPDDVYIAQAYSLYSAVQEKLKDKAKKPITINKTTGQHKKKRFFRS